MQMWEALQVSFGGFFTLLELLLAFGAHHVPSTGRHYLVCKWFFSGLIIF